MVVELRDEVVRLVQLIWAQTLEREVRPVGRDAMKIEGEEAITASVHVTGAWNGMISIRSRYSDAAAIASHMFAIPVDELTREEIHDAFAEIANITGGNIKGVLPGMSSLSLPTIVEGSDYEIVLATRSPTLAMQFESEGTMIEIKVVEQGSIRG